MNDEEWRNAEDDAAALWVARHLSSAVDTMAFKQWLAGHPDREARFAALWETCMDEAVTKGLRAHDHTPPGEVPRNPINDNAIAPPPGTQARFHPGALRTGPALAIAVSLAALAVGLPLAWPQVQFWLTPEQSYATAAGQVRHIALSDGSSVTLNGKSRLVARIGSRRRGVRLEEGEALFDVHHDAARPFTVTTTHSTITVLGTRFDVALNSGTVDLDVERGLVRFENRPGAGGSDHQAVNVAAAHQASLVDGRIAPPRKTQGTGQASAWRTGWLQVADTPLAQIVPQLERWSDKPIHVEDPALLATRVAGRFRLDQPATVLENLGILHGFAVHDTGHALIVARR